MFCVACSLVPTCFKIASCMHVTCLLGLARGRFWATTICTLRKYAEPVVSSYYYTHNVEAERITANSNRRGKEHHNNTCTASHNLSSVKQTSYPGHFTRTASQQRGQLSWHGSLSVVCQFASRSLHPAPKKEMLNILCTETTWFLYQPVCTKRESTRKNI